MQRLADEELMPLIAHKHREAYGVFYDRHGGSAYSLAYRMLGERTAAEDVTQEAFLSIWRSRAGYDPVRGSVRAWLLSVVRNRAIDALRSKAGGAPSLDSDDEATLERRPSRHRTDEHVVRSETLRELSGALAELPGEQAKVIELAYFGGFSHSEIAEMLGIPLGTVKGRLRLGLEKIRTQLAQGFS